MKNCKFLQQCTLFTLLCLASISLAQAKSFDHLKDGQDAFNLGYYHQAFEIWRGQAQAGDADAQMFVGLAYRNGWGVTQDLQQAAVWYKLSAEQQNTSAQFLLGLVLLESDNEKDLLSGIKWLYRAAENGDQKAHQFLSKAKLKNWFAVPDNLTVQTSEKGNTNIKPAAIPRKLKKPVTISSTIVKPAHKVGSVVLN